MKENLKFCVNCKMCCSTQDHIFLCSSPNLFEEKISLVTGKMYKEFRKIEGVASAFYFCSSLCCESARASESACGKEGKWHEAKSL